MRAFATGEDSTAILDALLCCECGVCELFACPMGIHPRAMNIQAKAMLRANGITTPDHTVYPEHSHDRAGRKIGQQRFIQRWELGVYPTEIDDHVVLTPDRVIIPLKQGVGKPSTPCVAVGDHVAVGQVIAVVDESDVGALVHASIAGRVTAVSTSITIEQ